MTGPSGSPIRSSRTRARRPASSETSMTSKARPTGSRTAAPGQCPQASVTSSSVAPAGTVGARARGCAPGAAHRASPQEQSREGAAARAPGTTSQPHSPVYSATAVHSEVRPRRRVPERNSLVPRLPPIVKPMPMPMPPPTGRTRRWLRRLGEDVGGARRRGRTAVRRGAAGGVPAAAARRTPRRARPERTPVQPVRFTLVSSESRLAGGEFIRRGGEWWRFRERPRRRGDRRITFGTRTLRRARAWVCRRQCVKDL